MVYNKALSLINQNYDALNDTPTDISLTSNTISETSSIGSLNWNTFCY